MPWNCCVALFELTDRCIDSLLRGYYGPRIAFFVNQQESSRVVKITLQGI